MGLTFAVKVSILDALMFRRLVEKTESFKKNYQGMAQDFKFEMFELSGDKRYPNRNTEEVHTFAAFLWLTVYLWFMYENGRFNVHAETSLANESLLDDPIPDDKIPVDYDARKGNYRFIILLLRYL
ncbi:hypothetical protein Anas_11491 [Armadillidium nasatum]|uniref:Uncharacterized protein n=1 Tax=Armadillidium nasatum TaxID=96803 RepID=A0A5N5TFI4_9CRUS|nr:hypothetical protein Anas_11491 [Armadillidium nasatum]